VQTDHEATFPNPYTGAVWSCYAQEQFVLADFNTEIFPEGFYRSLNTPCTPAAVFLVEVEYPLNEMEKKLRWTCPDTGVTYRIRCRFESQYHDRFPFTEEVKRYALEVAA
jgi:hypothetical protein